MVEFKLLRFICLETVLNLFVVFVFTTVHLINQSCRRNGVSKIEEKYIA